MQHKGGNIHDEADKDGMLQQVPFRGFFCGVKERKLRRKIGEKDEPHAREGMREQA